MFCIVDASLSLSLSLSHTHTHALTLTLTLTHTYTQSVTTDTATKTLVFTTSTIGALDIARRGDQNWAFAYSPSGGFGQHEITKRGVASLNFDLARVGTFFSFFLV